MQHFLRKFLSLLLVSAVNFTAVANTSLTESSSSGCIKLEKELCDFIVASNRFLCENETMPSEALGRCCAMIEQGCDELCAHDLYEALPDLAKCIVVWGARAVRPNMDDLVVGNNFSSQDQVIGLLNQVLCRLSGCVDITATLTTCCNDILVTLTEINNTLTTCCDDIIVTITECCADIIITLTVDIINSLTEITNTLTSCCATIETLTLMLTFSCEATPIFEAITITTSGIYCLADFIEGTIVIAADDVDLNLNNRRISGAANGIVINPGFARIAIHDGQIGDTTDQAILVGDGSQQITLENIEINSAGNSVNMFAIDFQGTATTRISEGLIRNVRIFDSASGIILRNTDDVQIIDSKVTDCINTTTCAGIVIFGEPGTPAACNEVINCQVCDLTSTSLAVIGILASDGSEIVFDGCRVGALSGGALAIGIEAIRVPGMIVKNCSVTNVNSVSSVVDGIFCIGIWTIFAPGALVENSSATYIGSDDTLVSAYGVAVLGSTEVFIDDVFVSNVISTTSAAGIIINDASDNTIIQNCSITNIDGSIESSGIRVQTNNVLCRDCEVTDITGGLADAFTIDNNGSVTTSDALFNCYCANIQGSSRARGFYVNSFNTYVGHCAAFNINAPIEVSGGDGYEATTTSTMVIFDTCVVENTSRNGIRTTGPDTQIQYCTAKNCFAEAILALFPAANAVIDWCHATNSGTGVFAFDVLGHRVTNCYAALNTTNYIGVNPALIVAPGGVPVVGVNIDA